MYLAASHVLVLVLTVPTSFTWVEPSLRVTNDSPFWSGCNIIQGSERLLCVRGNSNLQDYMKGSCKWLWASIVILSVRLLVLQYTICAERERL